MAAEESLAKRVRNGKITPAQFEERLKQAQRKYGGDDDDLGSDAGSGGAADSDEDSDDAAKKEKAQKDKTSVKDKEHRWLQQRTGGKKRK
mmetsp:Transcript_52258/g.117693  ORF Transcript_52258/g.117693 Transcript_52258/m.117693 type:complete len:90 (-) Transcript_52258:16-285(-)